MIAALERGPAVGRQALEAIEVEGTSLEAQDVSGRACLDRRPQVLAQIRDLPLDLRDRGRRGLLAVERVGEPVDRHDAVGGERQDRQHRAASRPAEVHRAALADDLERAQDADLDAHCAVAGSRRIGDR